MKQLKIQITKITGNDDISLPQYMSEAAAGMDIHAAVIDDVIIEAGKIVLIPTGLAIALPQGFEAQIRPRSGLAFKHGISLVNTPGTIDADYRGEIKIILINHGAEKFVIKRGERIAQMVINKVERACWETVDTLETTQRGAGGFGHTAK